jgi:hypothetical protein
MNINKNGSLRDYIGLPVLNKPAKGFGFFSDSSDSSKAIGVITDVKEIDDRYELTATIWDKFVEQYTEMYENNKPAAVSIQIKQ